MAEVDMSNLVPNSNKYKAEQAAKARTAEKEKLKAVVKKDSVVSTKKSLRKRFADLFIKEDIGDVKEYIIYDVIIPGAKRLFLNSLSMILVGEVMDSGKRGRSGYGRTNYGGYYSKDRERRSRERDRDRYYEEDPKIDYRNIVLSKRVDAEDVVDALHERIDKYDTASVADLFDLIDVAGKYTDNNWGWDDKRQIGIRRVSDGYLIDVDEARYLE